MIRTVLEKRASAVLFKFLISNRRTGGYLVPANVCPIVPAVFHKAGVPFEFLDICPETLALDLDLVEKRIRRGGCAGVLYVRTYGSVFDVERAFESLKEADPDLVLIDDRCLAKPRFEHSGACTDLELYSCGYSKFVDLSWGGWGHLSERVSYDEIAVPYSPQRHDDLVAQFRLLKDQSRVFEYRDSDWLDAGMVVTPWREFETLVRERMEVAVCHQKAINECYRSLLPQEYCLPEIFSNWRFHLWVSEPSELIKAISDAGLFASSHYGSLVPAFGPGKVPVAARLGSQVVNLFNDFRFDLEKAERAGRLAVEFLKSSKQSPFPWSCDNFAAN
jgi:dTDP-4-amino-4,6-dideoxygalactose transaminase